MSLLNHESASPMDFATMGRAVLEVEAESIRQLLPHVGDEFNHACASLLQCQGRVIVIGMGKSGHIGRKTAATLASTGTPAFFVHPGEASHGDLGMITPNDYVIALSNSGATEELLTIIPIIKRLGVKLIGITGDPQSPLAQEADFHLYVGVEKEACPLGLAPTASTTATLAMGDALAIALLKARGFSSHDFARSHPGGSLGRRLLVHASDIMHTDTRIPAVMLGTSLQDTLLEITGKGFGMTTVIDAERNIHGVFTDGDLRRIFKRNIRIENTIIDNVMTPHCHTTTADKLAVEALRDMQLYEITALPIIDKDKHLIGILHMHDVLRAGIS